jgi:GxxExxY protein
LFTAEQQEKSLVLLWKCIAFSEAAEFKIRDIKFIKQKTFEVKYKGISVKQFTCDFVVEDLVIVELKAIKRITDIEQAQLLNYLKAGGLEVGLLLNFGTKSLEYKRMINSNQ